MKAFPRICLLGLLLVGGCGCPTREDVTELERHGGKWIGGEGPFGPCNVTDFWFTIPIDDREFAALFPSLRRMSPRLLQLYGEKTITDRSVALVNQLPRLESVYLDHTGITEAGIRRLRRGIKTEQGRLYVLPDGNRN